MNQRNCIKCCVKSEIECAATLVMLSMAFKKSTMSRTQVQLWYYRFKKFLEDVNDDAMTFAH